MLTRMIGKIFVALIFQAVGLSSFKTVPLKRLHRPAQFGATLDISSLSYDAKAYEQIHKTCDGEVCEILSTSLPLDIEGTYFKNIAGNFEFGQDKVMHPFDADGMITAIQFQNGNAIFRNRIVGTKCYIKEKKAKKILHRGFGTQKRGGMLSNIFDVKIKNPANTNVIYWGKQLLALWEGGLPHRMEADSLRTFGESRIRGTLLPGQPFSAHPKIDPRKNRLVNFSSQSDPKTSKVTFFEYDTDFNVVKNRTIDVPGFTFLHDFMVTENYYIIDQAPALFDPLPFLFGMKAIAESISFNSKLPAKIYIVPRDLSDPKVHVVEVPAHFNFHFSNGYENEKGEILIDLLKIDELVTTSSTPENVPIWIDLDYSIVPYNELTRYTFSPSSISTGSGDVQWNCSGILKLSNQHIEFPVVNPKVVGSKYRYMYALVGSDLTRTTPQQGLIKLDLVTNTESTWMPEKFEFMAEPTYIPRRRETTSSSASAAEDDGYVAVYLSNGRDLITEFLLFDASDISKGPISRTRLPVFMNTGLHGSYADGAVFEEDDIKRKFKVNKALDSKRWNEMKGGFSGLGISYDF